MDFDLQGPPAQGIVRVAARSAAGPVGFGRVLDGWQNDPSVVEKFCSRLRSVPFDAYFFETPPVTADSLGRHFECVLVDAPILSGLEEDARAFSEHFTGPDATVTFESLGRDALLVAPAPRSKITCHAHLAAFLRSAPQSQVLDFWRVAARTMLSCLGRAPRWLSTSGTGVPWLHLRIDSRPKYYLYSPYRNPGLD